jgi:hypothetical protein
VVVPLPVPAGGPLLLPPSLGSPDVPPLPAPGGGVIGGAGGVEPPLPTPGGGPPLDPPVGGVVCALAEASQELPPNNKMDSNKRAFMFFALVTTRKKHRHYQIGRFWDYLVCFLRPQSKNVRVLGSRRARFPAAKAQVLKRKTSALVDTPKQVYVAVNQN